MEIASLIYNRMEKELSFIKKRNLFETKLNADPQIFMWLQPFANN
jgi:hypothetical protein